VIIFWTTIAVVAVIFFAGFVNTVLDLWIHKDD